MELQSDANELLIVGIGASAGGLEALQRFFEALPGDGDGVAFVVIVHLDPERESSLAELLRPRTALTVLQVTERVKIEPGHIYIIPPNKNLSVADGHLSLSDFERPRGRRAPIDLFFRSLAGVPGGGVGIVLSGSGADGTVGLKAIKERGGLVMVQDPDDAAHDSMARSAIATGLVDFVLPAEALARRVIEYHRDRHRIQVPEDIEALPRNDAEALYRILTQLRSRTGHDFSNYKHSTVLRRIGRRMQMNQIESLSDYLRYLRAHPAEAQALLKNLLISVTHFFRDQEAWEALAEQVIPKLFQDKTPEDQVRVWVPGCATGEEAYTIAILLLEEASGLDTPPDIQVFASDLDEDALAHGRQGLYQEAIAADVSDERLRRFFTKDGDHYRVKKEICERVLFAVHGLFKDPPFSKLDLISCRNLLMYLNRDLQENVFRLFHYGLRSDGYLFLGSAESADGSARLFRVVTKKHRIYQRQETGEPARLPSLQLSDRIAVRQIEPMAAPEERVAPSELEQHRRMLEQQVPPSVIVSRSFELLHLTNTAGRYLQRPGGRPSQDILQEVRPELRVDLHSALYQAFEYGRSTSTRPTEVAFNGDTGWVHLIVQPGREEHGTQDRALVIFAEVEATGLVGGRGQEDENGMDENLKARQIEVQRLREQLQATIEEYESSKEEMRASNEELQSINEEYKSTAEELETSKEELQSVNEELETVNQELKIKVEELSQTNSDLQNLMASTEIGTLFLNRNLRIQRYTPQVTELFNVMPGDVGRPITHLTYRIDYDGLVQDAEHVLRDLASVEREVQGREGTWFLMRLRPYRTVDDRIEGVVITFVDITERRRQEEARHRLEERYRLLVENVEEYAIILLDMKGGIVAWNSGAERVLGYEEAEAVGRPGAIIFREEDRAGGVPERELEQAAEMGQASDERWHVRKDGSRFWGSGVMAALYHSDGELRGFAKVMRDNTERKEAEEALREWNEQLERRVEERTEQVQNLLRALAMAEQEERHRIAQVLHDDLQQQLYGLSMTLGLVRARSEEGRDGLLEQANTILDQAIQMTRSLSTELSPPILQGDDLEKVLQWVATRKKERYGLEVSVEVRGKVEVPARSRLVLLYQALREVLFNVVKHAGVNQARVTAYEEAGEVVVEIEDEGEGFDARILQDPETGTSGLGLSNMGERMRLLGGQLSIDTAPGQGTRVMVTLPLQDNQAAQ